MSVHRRPRGRGLGAFSVRGVAKHTFKGSQPPSRGRHQRTTPPSSPRARSLFSSGASMSAHPRPRGRGLGALSVRGVAKHTIKGSQPPSRGRHQRTPQPSSPRAGSLFSREHRQAHIQRLPAPVSGASQAYPPALEDEGSEPFQSGASQSAHSKAPSPRLGGVNERAPPPSGTRARSLFSREHRKARIQRLPAPVSGASQAYQPALGHEGWEPFQPGASRVYPPPPCTIKSPPPSVSGASQAYHSALGDEGSEPFQSGASPSAHSKARSPRLWGVEKRTVVGWWFRGRRQSRTGGEPVGDGGMGRLSGALPTAHSKAPSPRLGGVTSVLPPRPRGRGLGAFSAGGVNIQARAPASKTAPCSSPSLLPHPPACPARQCTRPRRRPLAPGR